MKVIIDASNVAYYGKKGDDKPKLSNIIAAVKALEDEGHDFAIIADASLKATIDEKEKYTKLVDDEAIEEVPPGNNADHFILELAHEENAKILSNDLFRDFSDEFHDIPSKRFPYSFNGNEIAIGDAKKPKKVKNILQNICEEILLALEKKRWEIYKNKEPKPFTPLEIAKEAIMRMDKSQNNGVGGKIEGIFSKLPMFDKVMDMVDDVESSAPYIIFVLVHPSNYKEAVKSAGNISVTIADRLRLPKRPLIIVRNDLFMKPGTFELNILYSDEVEDESPFNVEIKINPHDEIFIKKNSRNIASTIAGRLGSRKFPFVAVKPDVILENPGEFEIFLNKNEKYNKKE
ncbi:MAG: Zc3h12a-like ribonuclease [Methanobrevibacter sp.]|nr:Zc3h12a-like ribonuclease [Methanobrevibacter sp.]